MTSEQPPRDEPYWWTPQLPRRGRRIWVPLLVVVLLTAAGAWPASAGYARSHVHVLADVEPLTCTGTEVTVEDTELWQHYQERMPIAYIDPDMRCLFRFRIDNRGPLTVHLQEVRLSTLGPTNANRVVATSLLPPGTEPVPDDPWTADAIFHLTDPYPIPSHQVAEFTVAFAYSSRGGMCEGCTVWFPDNPTVTIQALGISGERRLLGSWFGFRGTTASEAAG
jgi:hypothetical protein